MNSTEPVLDSAQITMMVVGITTTIGTVTAMFGAPVLEVNQDTLSVVTVSVVTIVNSFAVIFGAFRARSKVTPVNSPRNAEGYPMIPDNFR